jgi:arsenate reductase
LLDRNGVPFRFREYRDEPLSQGEIRAVLKRLGLGPRELLRTRDRAYRELGLTGDESDKKLVALMSEHPTLLQRPIGVLGDRAVLGRPPEALLELAEPQI